MVEAKGFGFYTINPNYLRYLYETDSEVYYNPQYWVTKKPFVGIVIGLGDYNYFIPLTSAKEKHKKWKNIGEMHFLVYEIVDSSVYIPGNIYKFGSMGEKLHILSVLDIKKMIPVPDGEYEYIDFNLLEDERYKILFKKEYSFCHQIRRIILRNAGRLYFDQMENGNVKAMCCDFKKLERASEQWIHI